MTAGNQILGPQRLSDEPNAQLIKKGTASPQRAQGCSDSAELRFCCWVTEKHASGVWGPKSFLASLNGGWLDCRHWGVEGSASQIPSICTIYSGVKALQTAWLWSVIFMLEYTSAIHCYPTHLKCETSNFWEALRVSAFNCSMKRFVPCFTCRQ